MKELLTDETFCWWTLGVILLLGLTLIASKGCAIEQTRIEGNTRLEQACLEECSGPYVYNRFQNTCLCLTVEQ